MQGCGGGEGRRGWHGGPSTHRTHATAAQRSPSDRPRARACSPCAVPIPFAASVRGRGYPHCEALELELHPRCSCNAPLSARSVCSCWCVGLRRFHVLKRALRWPQTVAQGAIQPGNEFSAPHTHLFLYTCRLRRPNHGSSQSTSQVSAYTPSQNLQMHFKNITVPPVNTLENLRAV